MNGYFMPSGYVPPTRSYESAPYKSAPYESPPPVSDAVLFKRLALNKRKDTASKAPSEISEIINDLYPKGLDPSERIFVMGEPIVQETLMKIHKYRSDLWDLHSSERRSGFNTTRREREYELVGKQKSAEDFAKKTIDALLASRNEIEAREEAAIGKEVIEAREAAAARKEVEAREAAAAHKAWVERRDAEAAEKEAALVKSQTNWNNAYKSYEKDEKSTCKSKWISELYLKSKTQETSEKYKGTTEGDPCTVTTNKGILWGTTKTDNCAKGLKCKTIMDETLERERSMCVARDFLAKGKKFHPCETVGTQNLFGKTSYGTRPKKQEYWAPNTSHQ